MPHGVYLDTNIYLNWAAGRLQWLKLELLRDRTTIFLAPTVLVEAIEDYWFNPDHVLPISRRALKLMHRHGAQRILPPEETALLHTLGFRRPQRYSPNLKPGQLRRWLRFAIGLPPFHRKKASDGALRFDKGSFKTQVDAYRDSYVTMLHNVRATMLKAAGLPPTAKRLDPLSITVTREYLKTADWRQVYFRRLIAFLPPTLSAERRAAIFERAMSAAFEFDSAIADLTVTAGYKPENHRGDPFDQALLTYLADPGLTFITADSKMVGRVGRSPQRNRIRLIQ
jgi:hypothetical protein